MRTDQKPRPLRFHQNGSCTLTLFDNGSCTLALFDGKGNDPMPMVMTHSKVDLDTIDISNLNRQFLFRKHHKGMSKSIVACDSIRPYLDPNLEYEIAAKFDSIKSPRYTAEYMKRFHIVLNALDNLPARRHVNRLCLCAKVPLIDGGTNGWLGQVQPFIPGHTGCFECHPKPIPKQFPICTIRSHPTEPIHAIVWAKNLFESLFGVDGSEPILSEQNVGLASDSTPPTDEEQVSASKRLKLREESCKSYGQMVFDKTFGSDIFELNSYFKSTEKLPVPLWYSKVVEDGDNGPEAKSNDQNDDIDAEPILEDQRVWNLKECARKFVAVVDSLKRRISDKSLVWDKDDEEHVDFVTSASNLRSIQFHIPPQSRFKIKSDAGNIIPSIATTNSIISGAIVLEAIKILANRMENVKQSFLMRYASRKSGPLIALPPEDKNEKCYICSHSFLSLQVDTSLVLFQDLISQVLVDQLNIVSPIVLLDDNIIYESGDDENIFHNLLEKTLESIKIIDNSTLVIEDLLTDSKIHLSIRHCDSIQFDNPSKPYAITD